MARRQNLKSVRGRWLAKPHVLLPLLGVAVAGAVAVGLFAVPGPPMSTGSAPPSPATSQRELAVIETGFGNITFEFLPDKAPGHVENFKKLARSGFYDSTTFHRVIPGFMIQGGDPNSKDDDRSNDGMGGPGYTIKAEFNDVSHKRGVVSMARARDPDSAGSQFFIVVADSTFLDKQYSAFGRVVEGMDVADKIVNLPRDSNDNPLQKAVMKRVRIVSG